MEVSKTIAELSEGDEVIGFYVMKKCDLKEFDGSFRLDIELSDRTGSLPCVAWDNAVQLREQVKKGDVVKVKARISTYREKLQGKIEKIRTAETHEYSPDTFLPVSPRNVEEMKKELEKFVSGIKDKHFSLLLEKIFTDKSIMEQFLRMPAGGTWHHPYIGGLLEHSLGVTSICGHVADTHPELNRDLLITAAILHDIGKVWEYSAGTVIEFTDKGRLIGHIVMGEKYVAEMCGSIDGFPEDKKMLLSHLMLAHQGFKEFSSPVEPMIPEGLVLYYSDEIDSKLNAVKRITANTRDKDEKWSEYIRNMNRYFYAPSWDEKG